MELREYGPLYSSWASSEQELQEPLDGMAGCVANCCSALEELTEDMSDDFLPVLREYVLYIESMKVDRLLNVLCVALWIVVVLIFRNKGLKNSQVVMGVLENVEFKTGSFSWGLV